MGRAVKAVMVCVNERFSGDKPSCGPRGGETIADLLEKGIEERRIDVGVERSICMGHCPKGPNARLIPGGDFLFGMSEDDVPPLLDRLERECGVRDENEGDRLARAFAAAQGD